MKTILKLILTALIIAIFSSCLAQQLVFEKKYTGINILPPCFVYVSGYPRQLKELPDSSILMLGWAQSHDSTGVLGGVVYQEMKKLDKNGNILWTRYFLPDTVPGVNTELWLNSFEVLTNGNILLVGEKLNGSGPGLPLAYVDMLDADGQQLFDTIYYNPSALLKPRCSAKSANGLAIGGYRPTILGQVAYIVKIDSNFTKEWEFQLAEAYGGTYSDFRTIISNPDGSFDCYGQTRWTSSDKFIFLFVRLNSQGQMTMVRTYADSLSPLDFHDACSGTGFRLMMGYCHDMNRSIILMKTDESGNLAWVKKYADTAGALYLPNAIAINHENEILITGEIDYTDPVNPFIIGTDIYLLKTDSAGNKLWDETYGTSLISDSSSWAHWECGWDVVPAMDGSYLLCASDNINATYGPVMSLLKVKEGFSGLKDPSAGQAGGQIYPNPFHDRAVLRLTPGTTLHSGALKVFDLNGKVVMLEKNLKSGTVILSRDGLPDGIYFLMLEDEQKVLYRGKFIVF